MPGNVQNAVPSGVLPQGLCTAFVEERSFLQLQNGYHDATVQRSALTQTSRRSFKLARRLTATVLATLKSFWDSHQEVPFLFYNPWEGTPVGSNYDASGNNTVGRYTVVFRGGWSQVTTLGRNNVPQIELVEVA